MSKTEPGRSEAKIIPFPAITHPNTSPVSNTETPPNRDRTDTAATIGNPVLSLTDLCIQRLESDKLPSYRRLSERFRDSVAQLKNLDEAIGIDNALADIADITRLLEKHPEFKPDLSVWRFVDAVKKSASQSIIVDRISKHPPLVRLLGWAIRGYCQHPATGEVGQNALVLISQCQTSSQWNFATGEVRSLK